LIKRRTENLPDTAETGTIGLGKKGATRHRAREPKPSKGNEKAMKECRENVGFCGHFSTKRFSQAAII
jgi:hypothetical protein